MDDTSAMGMTGTMGAAGTINAAWIAATLRRIAEVARANPDLAAATRDAIFESGLFDIFGAGERFNPVDALDTGGEEALRAHLAQLDLAQLRSLVRTHGYDPERATARWRSAARFVELIVEKARLQLEQERKMGVATKSLAEASWML
jgi:hypothetical protein